VLSDMKQRETCTLLKMIGSRDSQKGAEKDGGGVVKSRLQ